MHDEMERVFNVRIKPVRDGARLASSATQLAALRADTPYRAAAHELAYEAHQKPEQKLQKMLENRTEEVCYI